MSVPAIDDITPPRRPVLTLAFVIAALVVDRSPTLVSVTCFDRPALAGGELWRLLTAHLVHGVPALALLDLCALALFGFFVERVSRGLLLLALASSALLSSLAILACTEYERYVGSSALVSGLLVAAVMLVFRGRNARVPRVLAAVLLALFGVKLALELAGLWPTALGGLPPGYEPVAVAHLAGGLAGGASALVLPRDARGLESYLRA